MPRGIGEESNRREGRKRTKGVRKLPVDLARSNEVVRTDGTSSGNENIEPRSQILENVIASVLPNQPGHRSKKRALAQALSVLE